jgi:hypothetical protein
MHILLAAALAFSLPLTPAEVNPERGQNRPQQDSKAQQDATRPTVPPVAQSSTIGPQPNPQPAQQNPGPQYVAVIPSDDGQILFNAIIAFATVLQLILLARQSGQIQREFEATHRARVVVRKVFFCAPEDDSEAPIAKIAVEFADTGVSGAVLREVAFGVLHGRADYRAWEVKDVLDSTPRAPADLKIGPNGSVEVVYPIRDRDKYVRIMTSEGIFAVGYAVYSAPDSNHRFRLGFIRRADPNTQTFSRVSDPDFEYAD